jgi:hypothetical protein
VLGKIGRDLGVAGRDAVKSRPDDHLEAFELLDG